MLTLGGHEGGRAEPVDKCMHRACVLCNGLTIVRESGHKGAIFI